MPPPSYDDDSTQAMPAWRVRMEALRSQVAATYCTKSDRDALKADLSDMKTTIASDFSGLQTKLTIAQSDVEILKKIVYGAVALVLTSVGLAIVAIVVKGASS